MDSSLAPGCFGSALTFSATAAECRSCPFAAQCQPLHERRLTMLREKLAPGIVVKPQPRPRVEMEPPSVRPAAPATALTQPDLPVKVVRLMEQITRRGLRVVESFQAGRNPFDSPAFLHIAGNMLLAGGFDRADLRTALMTTLDWTYGTAQAHVGQVFAVLPAYGIATEQDGRLILKVQ